MPKIRKRLAIAFARNYAASFVENSQCGLLGGAGLTDDELTEVQAELTRIAKRIQSTVNSEVLAQLGTDEEIILREIERMLPSNAY